MVICCWSAKGGAGTTVIAAALAVSLAARDARGCVLVDFAGDAPAVLGLPLSGTPPRLGERAPDELALRDGLVLWPRGGSVAASGASAVDVMLDALARERRPVVVDAGVIGGAAPPDEVAFAVAASATQSLLVLRPCVLALQRAVRAPLRPSAVVLVEERDRALTAADVEAVLGVPVCARVRTSAQVARAVDAGLLATALPASLARELRHAA